MFSKLEVQVDDKCLTIWYRSVVVFRLWIDADNQLHGRIPHPEMVDQSQPQPAMSGNKRLEVHLLTKEKDNYFPMALPRLVSQRLEDDTVVRPTETKRNPSSGSSSGPLIDNHAVSNVLNAVLDSMLVHAGNESKDIRALESRRIAVEEHVGIGSVAAVRANFTRGTYGDPETLLQTRLSWLTRNEPERLRKMIEESKGGTLSAQPQRHSAT